MAKVRALPTNDCLPVGGEKPGWAAQEGGQWCSTTPPNACDDLDRTLDGPAMARALAHELAGIPRGARRTHRPAVGVLRAPLVDLLVQPHQPTRAGRTVAGRPPPGRQRAARCFDEGYLVGRIGLDTHRHPLRWSGRTPPRWRRAAMPASPSLRSLVLSPALATAYGRTRSLAPYVRDLTADTRGIPADQAAQFAALGLLTAVAEWIAGPRRRLAPGPPHRALLATC